MVKRISQSFRETLGMWILDQSEDVAVRSGLTFNGLKYCQNRDYHKRSCYMLDSVYFMHVVEQCMSVLVNGYFY